MSRLKHLKTDDQATEIGECSSVKMATLVIQQDLTFQYKNKAFFPPTRILPYPVP